MKQSDFMKLIPETVEQCLRKELDVLLVNVFMELLILYWMVRDVHISG